LCRRKAAEWRLTMSLAIGSDSAYSAAASMATENSKADSLKANLNNSSSSDEDLMEACKSFESYMLEQVFKSMESTVQKSEDEENDDYMNQFGDMLYEQYAKDATENQSMGLAQMLYESMKRSSK
jgi:flagellar protein FlgJ